jgi:hypothetical protein
MKRSLISRIGKLEASSAGGPGHIVLRLGWRQPLPPNYVGERHTVPLLLPGTEDAPESSKRYLFQERPGPDPAASGKESGDHYVNVVLVPSSSFRNLTA